MNTQQQARTHLTQLPAEALWTALVIDDNAAAFARRHQVQEHDWLPPGLLADPVWLLDKVGGMFRGEGTLIVPRVPGPYHDRLFEELDYRGQLAALIATARDAGWLVSDAAAAEGHAWLSFHRTDRATVHMGIASKIQTGYDQLVDPADPPAHIAQLLARYREAVGVAWRYTAGVTGVQLLRTLYDQPVVTRNGPRKRAQPLWIEHTDQTMTGAGDIMWSRRLTAEDKPAPMVAQFDVRMAYGAAAGMAVLPVDALHPTGATQFEPTAAGYWRIVVPAGAAWAKNNPTRPPLINPNRVTDHTAWLTTPLMILLHELGIRPEVIDSWTCGRTDRIMRGWYERLRDARVCVPTVDAPRLAAAIKATANSAIGMMRAGRGRIHRRIWADTIMDLARANLYRKIHIAAPDLGWPFRVEHDSAWYALRCPLPAAEQALRVGPAMGRFRTHKTWDTGQYHHERRAAAQARRAARAQEETA